MYRHIKPLLHVALVSIILAGCSESSEVADKLSFENQDIPIADKLKQAITKEYIASIGLEKSAVE